MYTGNADVRKARLNRAFRRAETPQRVTAIRKAFWRLTDATALQGRRAA